MVKYTGAELSSVARALKTALGEQGASAWRKNPMSISPCAFPSNKMRGGRVYAHALSKQVPYLRALLQEAGDVLLGSGPRACTQLALEAAFGIWLAEERLPFDAGAVHVAVYKTRSMISNLLTLSRERGRASLSDELADLVQKARAFVTGNAEGAGVSNGDRGLNQTV